MKTMMIGIVLGIIFGCSDGGDEPVQSPRAPQAKTEEERRTKAEEYKRKYREDLDRRRREAEADFGSPLTPPKK